ncbi:MFS transporter [Streptomyces sp. NRRL F-5123]|uniref:MFS transporter n=1 Tax=Streptomyces sp. NRRL F-5123 TaxID=1463856 RepID=UPI000A74133F|nr:MFS transporter [Streptomyces sp. NRRL F-5123]
MHEEATPAEERAGGSGQDVRPVHLRGPAPEPPVPLRRNFRFRMMWIGGAVSGLGSSMTYVAMPLLLLAVTGKPALAGFAAACRIAVNLVTSIPAGVWVDRLDRRRILLSCEAVRVVSTGGLVAALFSMGTGVPFGLVLGVAAVSGAADAFFGPAHAASLRAIVPAEQLFGAYSQEEARGHAALLAGPPLGGALYGLARVLPFLADMLSYAVSLVCLLLARVPRRPGAPDAAEGSAARQPTPGGGGMRADVGQAVRWVWQRPGIRAALAFSVLINLVVNAQLLPIITVVHDRGGNSAVTGLVLAASGVGGLLGSALSAPISQLLAPGRLMTAVAFAFGAALCAATAPLGAFWPAGMLLTGMVAIPALNVALKVLVAEETPEAMMGRLMSLLGVVSLGLAPLSPLLGGVLSQVLGGTGALLVLGGTLVACALLFMTSPALRALGVKPTPARPAAG